MILFKMWNKLLNLFRRCSRGSESYWPNHMVVHHLAGIEQINPRGLLSGAEPFRALKWCRLQPHQALKGLILCILRLCSHRPTTTTMNDKLILILKTTTRCTCKRNIYAPWWYIIFLRVLVLPLFEQCSLKSLNIW